MDPNGFNTFYFNLMHKSTLLTYLSLIKLKKNREQPRKIRNKIDRNGMKNKDDPKKIKNEDDFKK